MNVIRLKGDVKRNLLTLVIGMQIISKPDQIRKFLHRLDNVKHNKLVGEKALGKQLTTVVQPYHIGKSYKVT